MRKGVLTLSIIMLLAVSAAAFSDVPQTHWANAAVTEVSGAGLVRGYPDGTFRPDGTLTRAEFLAMCVRVSLGDAADAAGEPWWKPYYTLAVEAEWKLPFTEETICDGIARFEISSLLADAAGRDIGCPAYRGEFSFTDEKEMSDRVWNASGDASEQMQRYMDTMWAVERRLITGYPDGTFRPDGTLTRAEAATVLHRLFALLAMQKEGGEIAVVKDDFMIYAVNTGSTAEIYSKKIPGMEEISHITVMLEDAKKPEETYLWEQMFLNGNRKYVWGYVGFYEYAEDGTLRQFTDMPVLDYGYDSGDDSFVLICVNKDERVCIASAGSYITGGRSVMRLQRDGKLQTLLPHGYLDTFRLPGGETGGVLQKVQYATNGKVRVTCIYNWGMSDLHVYLLEIADGAASWVQMGMGNGYSY